MNKLIKSVNNELFFYDKKIDILNNVYLITEKGYLIEFNNHNNFNIDLSTYYNKFMNNNESYIYNYYDIIKKITTNCNQIVYINSCKENYGCFFINYNSNITEEQKFAIDMMIETDKNFEYEILDIHGNSYDTNLTIKKNSL